MTNKIAMIIASKNFRDEEYKIPKSIFEENNFIVTTASSHTKPSPGMLGAVIIPDILHAELVPKDYDAVVFIGGGGAREYFNDETAHKIAKDTLSAGKILGAICIAPSILANAGLLHGKKATVFNSEESNLANKGAILKSADVVKDGNIITATGPHSAEEFGEEIIKAIKSM